MNKGATHPKLMHLRIIKNETDFQAGQDIAKWDLVIEKDKTAIFLMT